MAQGSSWELAVAVPIKNHTFDKGQSYYAALQEAPGLNANWLMVDLASYPQLNDRLQYNDQILVGPSTMTGYRGETEFMQISGYEKFGVNSLKIHLKNRNNKIDFNTGDRIIFYGTGLAGGWEVPIGFASHANAEGIKMGAVCRSQIGQYSSSASNPPPMGSYNFQQNGSLPYIQIARKTNTGEYGYFLDWINPGNEYLINPLDSNTIGHFAVKNGSSVSSLQYFIYGDYHMGGWRKDNAQRLRIMLKSTTPSTPIIQQELLRPGPENIRERAYLIPFQYYRMGIKYYLDDTYLGEDEPDWHLGLYVDPMTSARNLTGLTQGISMSMGKTMKTWHNIASAPILLKSGISNSEVPTMSIKFKNDGIPDTYRGDLLLYTDDVWLEHAGGVNYSNIDGCLNFERYSVWPEHETLKIEKFEEETSYSLFGKKTKHLVSCRFNYVSQAFWDQFEILLSWQERGYSFNLHPYINDIPYVLMGKITIKDYAKDNFDLGLRSFTMEFKED